MEYNNIEEKSSIEEESVGDIKVENYIRFSVLYKKYIKKLKDSNFKAYVLLLKEREQNKYVYTKRVKNFLDMNVYYFLNYLIEPLKDKSFFLTLRTFRSLGRENIFKVYLDDSIEEHLEIKEILKGVIHE